MEKISQSHFDKSDLITVSCPQCSENLNLAQWQFFSSGTYKVQVDR